CDLSHMNPPRLVAGTGWVASDAWSSCTLETNATRAGSLLVWIACRADSGGVPARFTATPVARHKETKAGPVTSEVRAEWRTFTCTLRAQSAAARIARLTQYTATATQ